MKQAAQYNPDWKNLPPNGWVTSHHVLFEGNRRAFVLNDQAYSQVPRESCFPVVSHEDSNNLITALEWLSSAMEGVLAGKCVRNVDEIMEFARLTVLKARNKN